MVNKAPDGLGIALQGHPRSVSRRHGFVNYDVWILLTLIALAAAIVVPAIAHVRQRVRVRRAELETLRRIAAAEAAHYAKHHTYVDTLTFVLTGGVTLTSLRADTAGWSAVVSADSLQPVAQACGVFEGPTSFAPNSAHETPGLAACW